MTITATDVVTPSIKRNERLDPRRRGSPSATGHDDAGARRQRKKCKKGRKLKHGKCVKKKKS